MRDIKLLDCTLRDGGYINSWDFGSREIDFIAEKLIQSKTDLIELGYFTKTRKITDGSTLYDDLEKLDKKLNNKNNLVMINYGEVDIDDVPDYDRINNIYAIRVAFHKEKLNEALDYCRKLKEKGWEVFIQPMVTMSYSEEEIKGLLKACNEFKPASVAVVDSFGQMTPGDVVEKVKLFDEILDKDIALSFHAHNNLQNAYANTIRFIESVADDRKSVIDASIYGIGRGAGNLPTELIMNYLNKNYCKTYNIDPLLTATENVIQKYKEKNSWGYSLPYFISGTYGVHPSYVLAFMEKKTQNAEDIKCLIDMISNEKKAKFDADYANEIYNTYNNKTVDDEKSKKRLYDIIRDRDILLMGPGKTIEGYSHQIKKHIEDNSSFVIGVNGEYGIKTDAVFFSNKKRYDSANPDNRCLVMTTSNINSNMGLVFNYGAYLAKEYGTSDNALLMLLNILKSVGIKKVSVAGFDGYNKEKNFYSSSLELLMDNNYKKELNKVIKLNINKIRDDMIIETITPSINI